MDIYNDNLYNENDKEEYKLVIAFKNKAYLNNINLNEKEHINKNLQDKFIIYKDKDCEIDFNIKNEDWCNFYVSFENDLINNIIKKNIININNINNFNDIRIKINNLLGLICNWGYLLVDYILIFLYK